MWTGPMTFSKGNGHPRAHPGGRRLRRRPFKVTSWPSGRPLLAATGQILLADHSRPTEFN